MWNIWEGPKSLFSSSTTSCGDPENLEPNFQTYSRGSPEGSLQRTVGCVSHSTTHTQRKATTLFLFGDSSEEESQAASDAPQAPRAQPVVRNWTGFATQAVNKGCLACVTLQHHFQLLAVPWGSPTGFCQATEPEEEQHCAAFSSCESEGE